MRKMQEKPYSSPVPQSSGLIREAALSCFFPIWRDCQGYRTTHPSLLEVCQRAGHSQCWSWGLGGPAGHRTARG